MDHATADHSTTGADHMGAALSALTDGPDSTPVIYAALATAAVLAADSSPEESAPRRQQGRAREPYIVLSDEDAEPLLREGDCESACKAMRVDCHGFGFKIILAFYSLAGGIALLSVGAGIRNGDGVGEAMMVVGSFCLISSLLLIFFFYRPNNPIRTMVRRFCVWFCCNRRWVGIFYDKLVKQTGAICAFIGFATVVVAVVLSSMVMNLPQRRDDRAFVRATVSMWIIAFVACFPLGGGQRLRQWFHEHD